MRCQKLFQPMLSVGSLLLLLAVTSTAHAVPSFGRQTGLECSACHTAFPQLNEFGRQFKIGGYTMAGGAQAKTDGSAFSPLATAPLAMMIQTTISHIDKAPDNETDNTQVKFPSELSLFYAGRVTDKLGAFVQVTSEEGGSFNQDNTDIRFANNTAIGNTSLAYGLSINNKPTVQDPWNSTPAWGFPWFEAAYEYAYPDTMIASLGGNVAGMTAYGMWNNHIYTEAGAYKAANTGGDLSSDAITGEAPYWRFAYTSNDTNFNWMVGTFGMDGKVLDDLGKSYHLTDAGIDTQLQWIWANDQSLTLDASYIHEKQPGSQHINSTRVDLTWYPYSTWGFTVGYKGTASSSDALAPNEDYKWAGSGDLSGDAFQLQANYAPWVNTRIALQYTAYSKVEGSSSRASDNNQAMLGLWILF